MIPMPSKRCQDRMTNPIPINHALDQLTELNGRPVELEGVLVSEHGQYQLLHYPKAERRPEHKDGLLGYEPSVVLEFRNGSIQPNHAALARWQGKRVRVHGILRAGPPQAWRWLVCPETGPEPLQH